MKNLSEATTCSLNVFLLVSLAETLNLISECYITFKIVI